MAQDRADDEKDADSPSRGTSEDLPDFLRTEPIPITPDPQPEPDPESAQGPPEAQVEPEQQPEPSEEPAGGGTLPAFPVPDNADRTAPPAPAAGMGSDEQPEEVMAPPEERPRSRGKKVGLIAAASLLVLAVAYVGAAWYFADRVPADTTVAGVDISGLARADAIDRLQTELEEVITSEITVQLGESQSAVDPEASGLAVDLPATVDELVGFSLHPASVVGHLFGRGPHEPIIHSDAAKLREALTTIADDLNIDPVEGELAIVDGEIEETEPQDGLAVDVEDSLPIITEEWLQGPRPIELPEDIVPPLMDAERIEQARQKVVDPLFSGDVDLDVNEHSAQIPNETIIDAASLHLAETSYEVRLDPELLTEKVKELLPGLGESPENARFEFKDGKPAIIPSVAGAGINSEELAEVVATAAVQTGQERTATIELETTDPEFTTDDAEALGIKERVANFTTPVPYDPQRTKNLVNGAKNLNGILIKPGETFSLIEAFGPIDGAHGYVESGVVVNGFTDSAMGGGLSQLSTTMFNAAFEAGMEDVTHQPHSRYFDRYPAGREATLYLPNLDMKWKNNTPYGVLVQAWIDDDAHVALWSTKYWDTKITTGPRTNFTEPKTVYNTSPRCVPERGGSSGFTVTVQRIVSKDGARNDEYSRSYTHTYQPWNHVVCGEKPKPEKKKDDDD